MMMIYMYIYMGLEGTKTTCCCAGALAWMKKKKGGGLNQARSRQTDNKPNQKKKERKKERKKNKALSLSLSLSCFFSPTRLTSFQTSFLLSYFFLLTNTNLIFESFSEQKVCTQLNAFPHLVAVSLSPPRLSLAFAKLKIKKKRGGGSPLSLSLFLSHFKCRRWAPCWWSESGTRDTFASTASTTGTHNDGHRGWTQCPSPYESTPGTWICSPSWTSTSLNWSVWRPAFSSAAHQNEYVCSLVNDRPCSDRSKQQRVLLYLESAFEQEEVIKCACIGATSDEPGILILRCSQPELQFLRFRREETISMYALCSYTHMNMGVLGNTFTCIWPRMSCNSFATASDSNRNCSASDALSSKVLNFFSVYEICCEEK